MLSLRIWGFFRLQHSFILNIVVEVLYSPRFEVVSSLAVLKRAAELHSSVGLGSGAVYITGLIKQYFVRLA